MLALVLGAGSYMYTDASYVVHGYRCEGLVRVRAWLG